MRSHVPFEPIVTQFCMWGRVIDLIAEAKFYGNRLRDFGLTGPFKRHLLYLTLHCDNDNDNGIGEWYLLRATFTNN